MRYTQNDKVLKNDRENVYYFIQVVILRFCCVQYKHTPCNEETGQGEAYIGNPPPSAAENTNSNEFQIPMLAEKSNRMNTKSNEEILRNVFLFLPKSKGR